MSKKLCLPEIPMTWLMAVFLVAMVLLRAFGIDSWTTAILSSIAGFLFGVKSEQIRNK